MLRRTVQSSLSSPLRDWRHALSPAWLSYAFRLNRQKQRRSLIFPANRRCVARATGFAVQTNHAQGRTIFNMIFGLAEKYPNGYNQKRIEQLAVYTVNRTESFDNWLAGLKDLRARAKIVLRIRHAELGHFGDVKALGDGVSEMRIDWGPGYRVYFAREGRIVYLLLLSGGNKSTQQTDIQQAKALWTAIRKELS
jgi:putative addiction module killer protein